MAQIYLKGRKEPIEVTNEVARNVKRRWCGDPSTGAGKAEKDDILQLDDWAGEYGMIKMIELDKVKTEVDHESHRKAQEAEDERQRQEWLKLPPEKKALLLGHFKLRWSVHHGFSKADPPQDVLDKAYQIQLEYFRANPESEVMPVEQLKVLLPGEPASLANHMRMK